MLVDRLSAQQYRVYQIQVGWQRNHPKRYPYISVKRTEGSDTVLLNKALGVDSFSIPLSYSHDTDEFYFDIHPTDGDRTLDTVTISKSNEPHFESVDCQATMFHTLQQVTYTHNRIDSVVIKTNKVTYDAQKPHLLIYFKSLDS